MNKTCLICNIMKPLIDFYKHSQMIDGYLNQCKLCVKKRIRKHRISNKEIYSIRDSERYLNNPKRKLAIKAYAKTPKGKEAHRKACVNYGKKHAIKRKAQIAINNALRDGRVKKLPCLVCRAKKVQAHHNDYTKPLDVKWLCVKHHHAWHDKYDAKIF